MALIPWKGGRRQEEGGQLSTVSRLRGEVDRLFDSFFRDAFSLGERSLGEVSAFLPPVDVEETDKEVHVRVELPGVKPDELDLSIVGNSLIISGEKRESEERRDGGFVYQERRFGSFRREVPLPSPVEPDDVQAEYKDGVLNVRLRKAQEAMPKRIQVRAT